MPITAYLHICIDTEAVPPVVSQVRIMSDGNPTTNFSREMWVTVVSMGGTDYEDAQERILQVLRQVPVIFGWMNPFFAYRLFPDMPPPEPSADLNAARNILDRFLTGPPDPEPQLGLPALQRLDNLTFGEED